MPEPLRPSSSVCACWSRFAAVVGALLFAVLATANYETVLALGAVAMSLAMDGDKIREARLCLGAVAPIPWRSLSTEELLVGKTASDATFREAGEDALSEAEPLSQNEYKIPLTKGLILKAGRALAGR